MLVVGGGRIGGTHSSLRHCLWVGEIRGSMAVQDAGCRWRGFRLLIQSQMLVVVWRGGGSHHSPRSWLWGESRVFSRQSKTLVVGAGKVVGGRCGGSHGSPNPRRCLWLGEAVVLTTVPDVGCVGERFGSHGSFTRWLLGSGRGFGSHGSFTHWLWGVGGGGSHGCLRCWFWGGEVGFLMAVPDAGCGVGRGGGSHGSPSHWLWGEAGVLMSVPDTGCCCGDAGVLMGVPEVFCTGRGGFSWESQMLIVGEER